MEWDLRKLITPRVLGSLTSSINSLTSARVYVAAPTDKRNYAGNAPYCNKYRLHHYGSALLNVVNVIGLGIQRKTVESGFQACILFDSGAEKRFVSTAFTPFIDIALATLDTSYEVELVDGKVVSTNTILCGFGMDWLSYNCAVIVCYEKIVRVPLSNGEIVEIQ
ncbi:hypothetical protein Tco_0715010, partial [Tanacetum coccineum]